MPQTDPKGVPIARTVARMFATAQGISLDRGHSISLAGPGTSDTDSSTSAVTSCGQFTDDLLRELSSLGWAAHSQFIWTQHDYLDVERSSAGQRINATRAKLPGKFTGYSEGYGPMAFVTEGGARLDAVKGLYWPSSTPTPDQVKAKQRDLVSASLDYLSGDQLIGMAANYLLYDDTGTKDGWGYSGLLEPYNGVSAQRRPAFGNPGWSGRSSWGGLRRFAANWDDLGNWYKWDPAILSMHQNMLEWFAVGGDGALWHRWWYGNGWSGPGSLGGACSTGPAAISRADGIMDVFVASTDKQIWTTWFANGSWAGGWAPLGGIGTSSPAVCSMNSGHLALFVRSTDNEIWFKPWTSASGWAGGWAPLGGSAATGPAAVSRVNGRMDVFTVSGGQVWQTWYSGGAWAGGWAPLGAPPVGVASSPAASSWSNSRIDVFVRGGDGHVWQRFCDYGPSGSSPPLAWSAWEPIGGPQADSAPAAVSWHEAGRTDIIALRGSNMAHTWYG